ncbi:MAG: diaminopimelate epimerase, partial [Planctomycetota bacterium]
FRVEMGQPRLRPEEVPVLGESLEVEVEVGGEVWPLRCVGMGNPHAVAIVSDWEGVDVANVGGWIERHRLFPERVNVEFVEVCGRDRVRMRVWERGSGETLACGTGACAAVVACVLGGYTDRRVKVQLRGGELEVEWEESSNRVYMTGSADWVYEGVWRERW